MTDLPRDPRSGLGFVRARLARSATVFALAAGSFGPAAFSHSRGPSAVAETIEMDGRVDREVASVVLSRDAVGSGLAIDMRTVGRAPLVLIGPARPLSVIAVGSGRFRVEATVAEAERVNISFEDRSVTLEAPGERSSVRIAVDGDAGRFEMRHVRNLVEASAGFALTSDTASADVVVGDESVPESDLPEARCVVAITSRDGTRSFGEAWTWTLLGAEIFADGEVTSEVNSGEAGRAVDLARTAAGERLVTLRRDAGRFVLRHFADDTWRWRRRDRAEFERYWRTAFARFGARREATHIAFDEGGDRLTVRGLRAASSPAVEVTDASGVVSQLAVVRSARSGEWVVPIDGWAAGEYLIRPSEADAAGGPVAWCSLGPTVGAEEISASAVTSVDEADGRRVGPFPKWLWWGVFAVGCCAAWGAGLVGGLDGGPA